MSKKIKAIPLSTLKDEIRTVLSYDHHITVYEGCEFGDHWSCSCGKSDLDDTSDHLSEAIMEVVQRFYGVIE